ncbi:MAG: 3-keto-5-aminohexanoate cleavage enzyme [Solirubrobacteraceae bacterium]
MDDLIITVAADGKNSYPANPYFPGEQGDLRLIGQYVDSVKAGAAICHIHGVATFQPGSTQPAIDYEAWTALTEGIRAGVDDVVIQNGIAGMSPESKRVLAERQRPDMMSTICGPHDTIFRRDPGSDQAMDLYGICTRAELEDLCRDSISNRIPLEIEVFTTGPIWLMHYLIERELLPAPRWATIFLGWEGATWSPPTVEALAYLVSHLPPDTNWNISVMDPATTWELVPAAIAMGGHVRIGWEDNPFLPNGEIAEHNAQLVEEVVAAAERIGRDVATPAVARQIIGLR